VQRHRHRAGLLGEETSLHIGQMVVIDALAHLDGHRYAGRRCRVDRGLYDAAEEAPPPGQGRAAALAGDLRRRAADVHVDVVGQALVDDHADGRTDHGRVDAVQLDAARPLVGLERHHPEGLRVALHQCASGDHLADVETAVGPGRGSGLLPAQPPEGDVRDPRHGREHDRGSHRVRAEGQRERHVIEHGTPSGDVGKPMVRGWPGLAHTLGNMGNGDGR
jgi:hypothetical protein